MEFEKLDWKILDRLRQGFLSDPGREGAYWKSEDDLEQYDRTFAERIGWKWDAVIGELQTRGWTPPKGPVLDWGCGSGVAGRRVLKAWPTEGAKLLCHDHSALSIGFAVKAATRAGLEAEAWKPGVVFSTLVISHVVNELTEAQEAELLERVNQATAVLWVEPGTHAVSRRLAGLRDRLRTSFQIIGPCTHAEACPLFLAENASHWCHAFAEPPKGIYADSNWVRFGQRAGVDLRSLPYSWLVLDQRSPSLGALPTGCSRRIGRAATSKADARWLECFAGRLRDVRQTKRENPLLWKALEKRPGLSILQARPGESGNVSYREVWPHGISQTGNT